MWHTSPVIHPSSIHPSIHKHFSFPDCCNPREGLFFGCYALTKQTACSLSHWVWLQPAGQVEKPLQARPVRLSPACVLRESRDDKVCTLPGVPPQFLHTPTTPVWRGVCSHNSLGPFSFLSLARHSKIKGSSDESGGGPQGVCRVEVWSVLFLPCYPILTWTPSGNTQRRKFIFLILWFNRAAQLIKINPKSQYVLASCDPVSECLSLQEMLLNMI